MYQGVFTQCRGVAHNSRFSDLPQSVESFLFTFQYLHLWGIIFIPILVQYGAFTIPYICCFVRGIYHPAHFEWGIYPSILGCFSLHITSPFTLGCINSHGALVHPVFIISQFLWTHGAPFLPIVIFAALIYPTFHTHGHLDFSSDYPKVVSGPFSEISFFFPFSCMDFIYFHQIMSFQTIYQCIMAWSINPSHSHCSSLIFMAYHHGALNLPIYLRYVGHSFLPTAKYTNFGIYPGFFHIFLIYSPIGLTLSIFWDIYVFYLASDLRYSLKSGIYSISISCAPIWTKVALFHHFV